MINTNVLDYGSNHEKNTRNGMLQLFKASPIPEEQILSNLGLFLSSKNLSRILFLDHIYRMIIDAQGVIFDFGTRWGQNLSLFAAFRGIYEPFNRHRKIVGFDTFSGFPNISKEDGGSDFMQHGNLSVTEGYDSFLNSIMECQENDNPICHIKKFEIIKGDASHEVEQYLNRHPETIVALAYFDFDLYEPTKKCLEVISKRLIKGSVLAFDELNDHDSPGETMALIECIGLNNIRLKRYRYTSRTSYFLIE